MVANVAEQVRRALLASDNRVLSLFLKRGLAILDPLIRITFASDNKPEPPTDGRRQVGRLWLREVRQIGLAAPSGMPLFVAQACRGDRLQHFDHQRVGAESLGENREPVAPEPRAIAAGEAHDHVGVVAQAQGPVHENRM